MLGGYLALAAVVVKIVLANSTYEANLGLVAAALPANVSATPAGFATTTVGVVLDLISTLALCRGDANASTCHACVTAGFSGAQRDCPNRKDVTIYQDDCVLRFSDQRFLDLVGVNSPASVLSSDTENLTVSAAWFNAAALALMNATVDHAVTTNKYFFAIGEDNLDATNYPKIYGLAQCVPDMTAAQCRSCLSGFIASMPFFLNG